MAFCWRYGSDKNICPFTYSSPHLWHFHCRVNSLSFSFQRVRNFAFNTVQAAQAHFLSCQIEFLFPHTAQEDPGDSEQIKRLQNGHERQGGESCWSHHRALGLRSQPTSKGQGGTDIHHLVTSGVGTIHTRSHQTSEPCGLVTHDLLSTTQHHSTLPNILPRWDGKYVECTH